MIIYYTSNREDESFENKIRSALHGNIISVSQKPIKLGKNICVGEHRASTYNTKKQIYEGLKVSKSNYVWMAEADFLYPPEYFTFKPEGKLFYCFKNIHVVWSRHKYFYQKIGSEGAMICHRESLMEIMEGYLKGWDEDIKMRSILRNREKVWVENKISCITFKTGNGCSLTCPFVKGSERSELPFWGKAVDLKNEYL